MEWANLIIQDYYRREYGRIRLPMPVAVLVAVLL